MQPSTIQQTEDSSMKVGIIAGPDGRHGLLPFTDASGVVRCGLLPSGGKIQNRPLRTEAV